MGESFLFYRAMRIASSLQLASKEKKRKELEKKFFQAAKNKLSSEVWVASCSPYLRLNSYSRFKISAAADEVKCAVDATYVPWPLFIPFCFWCDYLSTDRENVYAKFILDYAASEDAIRALWMEIKKEEQTLVVRSSCKFPSMFSDRLIALISVTRKSQRSSGQQTTR
jgi:hypothetical protein